MINLAYTHTPEPNSLQKGFTIVELLIVVVVIGILAAISLVAYANVQTNAAKAVLKSDLHQAGTQLDITQVQDGSYPGSSDGLPRSQGTNFDYTGGGNEYCLTAWSEAAKTSFHISSATGTVREGPCDGHTGYTGGTAPPVIPDTQIAKLLASDGAAGGNFGSSVAIVGDTAIIGAYGSASVSGSAYIFTRTGSAWIQTSKLTASDGTVGDNFGSSVALSGDTAVIGAGGNGAAYIFTNGGGGWTQQAKLIASDGATNVTFGASVALSGDTALIGAYTGNSGGSWPPGSAYVFTRSGSTWTEQAKLTASDGTTGDRFGSSVALADGTALIGAYARRPGSVYVFTRSGSTWTETNKLTASDGAESDQFGRSVAISGDRAIIGATGYDAAYVFTRSGSTWTQQDELTPSDGTTNFSFGSSVAISGDTIMVGANGDTDKGYGSGSAYIFTRSGSTWTQQTKLTASDAATLNYFGWSVAISGDTAIAGAHRADSFRGSAYVFGPGD